MAHYRVEFLDGANAVVCIGQAEADSRVDALLLVAKNEWPAHAKKARAVDRYGRLGPCIRRPWTRSTRGVGDLRVP